MDTNASYKVDQTVYSPTQCWDPSQNPELLQGVPAAAGRRMQVLHAQLADSHAPGVLQETPGQANEALLPFPFPLMFVFVKGISTCNLSISICVSVPARFNGL